MSGWGRLTAGCCVLIALLLFVAFVAEWPPFATTHDESAEQDLADELVKPLVRASPPKPTPPAGSLPELAPVVPAPPPPPPEAEKQTDVPPPEPEEAKPPDETRAVAVAFTGAEILKSLDKGVAYLRKKQARNGSWGSVQAGEHYGADHGGYPAGPTALVLYALLRANQPTKDPVIKRGFSYLARTLKMPRTSYETSMLLLALTATADEKRARGPVPKRIKLTGKYRSWAAKLVDHLVGKRSALGWRYDDPERPTLAGGAQDLSSTQLAALALLSAMRCGMKVRDAVWEDVLRFTLEQQEAEGPSVALTLPNPSGQPVMASARGFTYVKRVDVPDRGEPTGGMTACGIANLLMAKHALSGLGRREFAWTRHEQAPAVGVAIGDGLAWLDAHWSPFEDPGKGANKVQVDHAYWLWMLECAMDLGGLKHLGSRVWYVEAGRELLRRQRPDGSWMTKGSWQPADTLDTAFAILFLGRASRFLIERE